MKTNIRYTIRAVLLGTSLACLPHQAAGASASELLEKGIYQEETKGDLDSAISIYQQLLGDAKNAQALAAQAQFRLAQCYEKKNRHADAVAAFERVIRDYPDQKDLVAKARANLPAELDLQPAPWVDGERLQLTLSLASGLDIGTVEYRAIRHESNGRKLWQVGSRTYAQVNSLSKVDVDAETFAPVASFWKHGLLGEASATFRPGEVEIARAGKESTKVAVDKAVYDNEQCVHLIRRLPLDVGYKASLPIIASLGAGAVIPITFEVTTKETVQTPAGEFECFKVVMNVGQTFWFSADAHRYLVKFDVGGALALLNSIAQRGEFGPVVYGNEAAGISLTAPPDWVLHLRAEDDKAHRQTLYMLDPQGDAKAVALRLYQTDKLSAKARAGVRAWAEADFADNIAKEVKDAKIRSDSWRPYSVSGRAGMSFVADFVEKDQPMVVFAVYAIGGKTSENFALACAADKFDALRPAFESIVTSYRSK